MNKIPNWCRELANLWVNWRREMGLENGWPIEEYAYYIADSYQHLPSSYRISSDIEIKIDEEKWMYHIFEFIKNNDHWKNACSTPHQLKDRYKGSIKIMHIFPQAISKKNVLKIMEKELDKSNINEIPF